MNVHLFFIQILIEYSYYFVGLWIDRDQRVSVLYKNG